LQIHYTTGVISLQTKRYSNIPVRAANQMDWQGRAFFTEAPEKWGRKRLRNAGVFFAPIFPLPRPAANAPPLTL